jgi:hypothetical protein
LQGSLLNHQGIVGRRQGKRRQWSVDEENALRQAVAQNGASQWACILLQPRFAQVFAGRTNVDLKGEKVLLSLLAKLFFFFSCLFCFVLFCFVSFLFFFLSFFGFSDKWRNMTNPKRRKLSVPPVSLASPILPVILPVSLAPLPLHQTAENEQSLEVGEESLIEECDFMEIFD